MSKKKKKTINKDEQQEKLTSKETISDIIKKKTELDLDKVKIIIDNRTVIYVSKKQLENNTEDEIKENFISKLHNSRTLRE